MSPTILRYDGSVFLVVGASGERPPLVATLSPSELTMVTRGLEDHHVYLAGDIECRRREHEYL
jgi:hypothetical protein